LHNPDISRWLICPIRHPNDAVLPDGKSRRQDRTQQRRGTKGF
jgi:hypothetical protein